MNPSEREVEGDLPDRVLGSGQADVDRLMQQLSTVTECDQAASRLARCGPRVIPALRRFLFDGRPSVVYQPRRAAVEALGELRAKDILVQFLTWKREIKDPATRFGEESVRNAAARELAKFRTQDVLDVLLGFALPQLQPGIVEALAQFGTIEAIPYFLLALEDDLCQAAAMDGLRNLGREAELVLVASALTRLPSSAEERPSSLRRRAKVLELLAEISPAPAMWPLLRRLLDEDDAAIITATAKIAIPLGNREDRTRTVRKLLAVLPRADWFLREEIQNSLVDLYPDAESLIEQESAKRSELPQVERLMDSTFRVLENVRRRVEQGTPRAQQT